MTRSSLFLSILVAACGPASMLPASEVDAGPMTDASAPLDAAPPTELDGGRPPALDGGAGAGPVLGTTTVLGEPCPRGRLLGPGQRCEYVEVDCAHAGTTPNMRAELRITEPTAPERGTVWLGSGSQGGGFYGGGELSSQLVRDLSAEGFRVVERAWEVTRETQGGWFTGTSGVRVASCRSATLMEHVRRTLTSEAQPLCASANSGGSMELAYAASVWRVDRFVDLLVPTSGPAHRVDLACAGASDATWLAECEALQSRYDLDPAVSCELDGPRRIIDQAYGGRTVCTMPTAADLPALRADSPIGAGATSSLVAPLRFLYGGTDAMGAVTLGIAYAEALREGGTDVRIEVIEGGIHDLGDDPTGSRRIFELLRDECVSR